MDPNTILFITYYLAGLLLNAFVAMGLAIIILKARHKPGSTWLGLLFLASAWWSFAVLGELLADTLPVKIFWSKVLYLGAGSVPVLMFFFVMAYCRRHKWLAPRYRLLYWIVPLITIILVATNEWHNLIWASFTPRLIGDTEIIVYGHGPGYWLIVIYSYLLMAISTWFLLREALRQSGVQRQQAIFLLLIIFLPWLTDLSYNLNLLPGIDFTVFGLTISGSLMLWNLGRLNLLNLIPLAIDQAFERIHHAVVVLDNHHRVASYNPAAQQILGMLPAMIGQPAPKLLTCYLEGNLQADYEIEWPDQSPRILSISVTLLTNRKNKKIGYMLTGRDITAQRRDQREKWEHQLARAVIEEREQYSHQLHAETRQVLEHIAGLAHNAIYLLEEESYAEAATSMAHLVEIARDNGAEINEFIKNSPSVQTGQPGFFKALNQYISHFGQTHNIPVTLTYPSDPADYLLPSMAQIQLLLIIQDILLHSSQQAVTEAIQLVISVSEAWIQTVITLQTKSAQTTVDLQAIVSLMEQRTVSARGTLEIRSIPNQGSHVIVQLPRRASVMEKSFSAMRILLVDDHGILLAGFKELLERQGAEVVGMATNGPKAIDLARQLQPDIILMDIRMPGMSGIEATRRIKAEFPNIKIVILTVSLEKADLFEALRNGASGYLLKTLDPEQFFELLTGVVEGDIPLAPELIEKLVIDMANTEDETVVAGVAGLTSQQMEVLRLVAQGNTYRETGDQLHISEHTVRYHMEQIRKKLNVSKRIEVVARAIQLGLVEAPRE